MGKERKISSNGIAKTQINYRADRIKADGDGREI